MERFGPTRRGGPVFRWLGEPLAIDLANTIMVVREGDEVDLLADENDLRRWLDAERDRLGTCRVALNHLDEIRALRDGIHQLFMAAATRAAPARAAVETVNAASAVAPIAPQLCGGSALEFQERSAAGDPLAQLLGKLARSAISVLTGPDRQRLHICTAPSCGMFYVGNRRWCCAACGNRARAARHYERTQRGGPQRSSRR